MEEIDDIYLDTSENDIINTYNDIYVHKNLAKYVSQNEIEKINKEEFLRLIVQENFSAENNINRHTRLNKISLLEKNEKMIIPLIHSLVQNLFLNFDEKIKISISIYLKNIFEKFIISTTITISNFENLSETLLILLKEFYSSPIPCKVKIHLKQAIKNLILAMCKENFKDHTKYFFKKIFKEMCNELESNKDKYLNFDSLQNFCDIYEIILITRKEYIHDNSEFEESLFIFHFILRNIHDLKFSDRDDFEALDEYDYENDELNPTDKKFVNKNLKICKIFVEILTQILQNNSATLATVKLNKAHTHFDLNSEILFLNNKNFLQLINLVLYLDNHSLKISLSLFNEFNFNNILNLDSWKKKEISNLKNNLLVSLTNCVKISTEITDVNTRNFNCPLFADFCNNLTGDILKSFKAFNTYFNISLLKDVSYEDIDLNIYINSCLMFLVECLHLKTAAELLRSNMIEIFRYVLMPMLRVSLAEKEAFIIDHEEYTKIVYDFTYSFKSNQIKSQGLNLLVGMCNVFDDFTKFVGNFYIEILINLMQKDNSENVNHTKCSSNYSYLEMDVNNDYTREDAKSLFLDYVHLALTEEDLLEQSLQVLATLQACLYNSNRCEYYFIQNKFFHVFKNFLMKVSLTDFIKSKLCMYCFAFLRFGFRVIIREENLPNLNENLLELTDSNFCNCLSYLSENLFNESKANISIRFLALQFLNDLLFDKKNLNCPKIKNFFGNFIQNIITKRISILIQLENKSYELSTHINFFMMNLIKNYYNVIEDVIFPIFQNFLNKTEKEIDKYCKSNSLQEYEKVSKKSKNSYHVSSKISDYIQYIYLITKNSDTSRNLTIGKNIFYANFEALVLNSAKFFNFIYEEDILKICQLTIPKITQFNSQLEKCFLKEYFTVIKYFEFNLKDYHLDYLISITKLVICSVNTLSGGFTQEGLLSRYKEKALTLLSEGFNHVINTNDKIVTTAVVCYLERDFHLASYMLAIASMIGSIQPSGTVRLLSFTDCLWINQVICRRIMINKNKVYLGPLASRIFLVFHTVIIYLVDNFEYEFFEYFMKNKNENFECLVKENFSICGDHYSEIENRISVIYSIRLLQIILKSCFSTMTVDQFLFIKEQIIFAIQQLAYITFKNYHQLRKEEKEFEDYKLKRNKKDFGLEVINKEKFIKNSLEENNFLIDEEVNCEDLNLGAENLQEDFNLDITNEYIDEKDNSNEDEEELFMLDLTNEKELEMFNLKMTAELFLKRKRLEYSVRNHREDQIDSSKILESLELFSRHYEDEFLLFFQFLDKFKEINEDKFTQLFLALPKYIIDICSKLRSWKRVDIPNNMRSKARKIIKLKRSVD